MAGWWEVQPQPIDLVIAIPTLGSVTLDWCLNLLALQKPARTVVRTWRGLPVDVARDALVRDALKMKAKYIFFLDSDQFPEPPTVFELMAHYLPICSAAYWSKRGHLACWKLDPGGDFMVPLQEQEIGQGPMRVDAVGMGCALVDTRVFQVMKPPWFKWQIRDPTVQLPNVYSEDLGFCREAWRDYGIPVYVLGSLRCGHEHTTVRDIDGKDMKLPEVF